MYVPVYDSCALITSLKNRSGAVNYNILDAAWCAIIDRNTHIYLLCKGQREERERQREEEREGGGLCATSVPMGAALSN